MNKNPIPRTTSHRADIQGLRAIAVLLVIAAHAGVAPLAGGVIGVDVFFVVSGFLITSLLVSEADEHGHISIRGFYARRARRILPAATVVLLATLFYASNELSATRVAELRQDATWSAAFLANVHFADIGVDYFEQGRAVSAFQHFWSLAVEEQFYLCWPLMLAAVVAAGGRTAARRHRRGVATSLVLGIVVASFVWSVISTASRPTAAYFSSSARAWELACGAALALAAPHLARLPRAPRHLLAGGGLLAILAAAALLGDDSALPGWRVALPVLGTTAVLAAGTGDAPVGVARALTGRLMSRIGDLSYSLYLWHWPFLVLAPLELAVPATFAASFATYHLVEQPVRRWRLLKPWGRSLVLWPAALASVVLVSSAATAEASRRVEEFSTPQGPAQLDEVTGESSTPRPSRTVDRLRARLEAALAKQDRGAPVRGPLDNVAVVGGDLWHNWFRCAAGNTSTSVDLCPRGAVRSSRTLVLYGDSHAGHWLPAIARYGAREDYRVIPLVKAGCPPYDFPITDGGGAEYRSCNEFRRWAETTIKELDPELIVFGSQAMPSRMYSSNGRTLGQTWSDGIASTLDTLGRDGASLALLGDIQQLGFDPVDCLTEPGNRLDDCTVSMSSRWLTANATMRRVARQHGAAYVDVVETVCVRHRCPLVVDRIVTYGDYDHLSLTWVAEVAPRIRHLLNQALRRAEPSAPPDRPVGHDFPMAR